MAGVSGSRAPGGRTTGRCGQAQSWPQRAQAVAAVGPGLVAADGIAQRGPRGVGTDCCRPVAQDPGEKIRLGDGLRAGELAGGPLGESGELSEGFAQIPELAQRARAPVVDCVIEAGQPDSAVLDVHHRSVIRMPFRVSGLSKEMVAIRSSHGACSRFVACHPSVKARPAASLGIP